MDMLLMFQSTFPRGERQRGSWVQTFEILFQSTFPRGERQKVGVYHYASGGFQSTFPRGERRAGIPPLILE